MWEKVTFMCEWFFPFSAQAHTHTHNHMLHKLKWKIYIIRTYTYRGKKFWKTHAFIKWIYTVDKTEAVSYAPWSESENKYIYFSVENCMIDIILPLGFNGYTEHHDIEQ